MEQQIEKLNIKLQKKVSLEQVFNAENPDFSHEPKYRGVPLTSVSAYGSYYTMPTDQDELRYEEKSEIPLTGEYESPNIILEDEKLKIKESGIYFVTITVNCRATGVNYLYLLSDNFNGSPEKAMNLSDGTYNKTMTYYQKYYKNDEVYLYKTGGNNTCVIILDYDKGPQISVSLFKLSDILN